MQYNSVVTTTVSKPAGHQIKCHGEPTKLILCLFTTTHTFLGDANVMFCPKNSVHACQFLSPYHNVTSNQIHNLCTTRQMVTPLSYQCIDCLTNVPNFGYLQRRLIIDQIVRKRFFSKIVPVFRKYLSVSRWNLPGYFSVSFRFPQVTEFGKSAAIYLANSFCQLYSALWSAWQEDPNDPQERCAMARTSCARLQEINFACEFAVCS